MIYRITWESHFTFADTAHYAILKAWKSPQPKTNWEAIPIKANESVPNAEVTGLHQIMLWSQPVVDELLPLLGDYIQALPVYVDTQTRYAIHVTHVQNCLHQDKSQFRRFKNRNIGVEHYVLQADCLIDGETDIFTVPDDGYSSIFVSERVKQIIDAEGWTGLKFIAVDIA